MDEFHPQPAPHITERAGMALWRLAHSPVVSLTLPAALLAVTLFGAVAPQAGPLLADSAAAAPSLARAVSSLPFQLLLALCAAVGTLRGLYLVLAPERLAPVEGLCGRACRLPAAAGSPADWAARAWAPLGLTLSATPAAETGRALLYRPGARRWLPGLLGLGLALLSLALIVGARLDWAGAAQTVALGESVMLDPDGRTTARLDALRVSPAPGHSPSVAGELTLLSEGQPDEMRIIAAGRPVAADGRTLYQIGSGPAARLSAQAGDGRFLDVFPMLGDAAGRRVARVAFPSGEQEHLLVIPGADLAVRLVWYPADGRDGSDQILAQVLRGRDGRLMREAWVADSAVLAVDGYRLHVAREYYVVLQARRTLSLWLAAPGAFLLLAGALSALLWPPRLAWLSWRQEPGGALCTLHVRPADEGAPWIEQPWALLGEVCHDGG